MVRKSRDATKEVFHRLEKGPASPKMLKDELDLNHSSVMYALRESILAQIGLFKQLPGDKYAVKWFDVEEDVVKTAFNGLKKKLFRSPTPEEFAGHINKKPNEARDLLLKNIPGYREPTEDEIAISAKVLWKMLTRGSWISSDLPTKKEFFEKGVIKVVVEGIDQETLNEILQNKPSVSRDDSNKYFAEFPEMKPIIIEVMAGKQTVYKVHWNDEVKRVLRAIDSWNKTAQIRIPLRFDEREGKYRFGGQNPWEAICHAEQLAEIYAPS